MKKVNPLVYTKGVIGLLLLVVWSIVAVTGFIMWMAPHGQGTGSQSFLLNMSRHDWGELHFWFAVTAVVVTIVHIVVDWKPFVSSLKHIFKAHELIH